MILRSTYCHQIRLSRRIVGVAQQQEVSPLIAMKETMTQPLRCLALTLAVLFVAGCGSGADLAKVKGEVTLNGQPLEGATVTFQSTEEGGAPSSGQTDEKGRYTLMYSIDTPGAQPGEHVVSIETAGTDFDDQGNEIELPERVPAEFRGNPEFKRTVEPGGNTIDFEL